MAKRGPTDTDRPTTPTGEPEYEVVTAAQIKEREDAKSPLRQRLGAVARGVLNATDERSTWQPGELADPDQTIVTDNRDVAIPEETPPPKVMRELRKRSAAETEQRLAMAGAKVGGLMEIDRWMRLYAIAFQYLANLAVLVGDGKDILGKREVPDAEFRAKFRRQIDEWDRDIEAGGS